jgi:hypothetical protein
MDVLLGITGKDFTLVAAPKAPSPNPSTSTSSNDTRELNKHTIQLSSENNVTLRNSHTTSMALSADYNSITASTNSRPAAPSP